MTKKIKKLTDKALFDLAETLETNKARVRKAEGVWRAAQTAITTEMMRRGVRSLTNASLKKITMVAPETVVYDAEAMWAELSPAKRRKCFDTTINLGALPKHDQEALLAVLTPAQRAQVVGHRLNEDKLADALEAGVVDQEFIMEHSEIKQSSPYVKISQGEAS